jgi:hypothetical protein
MGEGMRAQLESHPRKPPGDILGVMAPIALAYGMFTRDDTIISLTASVG